MRVLLVLSVVFFAMPAVAKPRMKELIAAFNTGKTEDRMRLAIPLGRSRDKKAADVLLIAYNPKGGNPKETLALTEALGLSGDIRAVDALAGAWDYMRTVVMQLGGDLPPHLQVLRWKILEAFSRLGGDQAVAALSEALNDADPRVVEEAVRGLGRLQVKDAVPALQQLAGRGESQNLRQAVFEALGDIGDKRAVSTLQQALTNPDKYIEVQAAYAMAKLGQKDMVKLLESSLKNDPGTEKVGILAAYYLVKLDKTPGLEHLDKLVRLTDTPYAALAADALGKSDNPRAILVLSEHLKHPDPSVRLSVARGLGQLGGARAAGALKKIRADSNAGVRNAVAIALVDLGETD